VAEIYIDYPYDTAKRTRTESNVSFWAYRKLVERIALAAENLGVRFTQFRETTPRKLRLPRHRGSTFPSKPIHCPLSHAMHSDVNAALDIL
jgi:transposase